MLWKSFSEEFYFSQIICEKSYKKLPKVNQAMSARPRQRFKMRFQETRSCDKK